MSKTRWFGVCATLLFFFVVYVIERNRAHLGDLASSNISDNLIPMVIVQLGKGNGTHDSSLRRTNPGFEFLYFNDDDINKFLSLNYPEFLKSFQRLPLKIMKIDFFRYIAILHFGGFYFDQDVEGVKPLDENIRNHDAVFPVDTYLDLNKCKISDRYNSRFKEFCVNGSPIVAFLLGQYAFGAKKQNSFIKSLVHHIHNHAEQYNTIFNNNSIGDYNYVYKTTGPDFVTSVYVDSPTTNKNGVFVLKKEPWMIWETFFAPILGEKKDRSRTNPYRYFGNYAVHLNRGSWKAGGGDPGGV